MVAFISCKPVNKPSAHTGESCMNRSYIQIRFDFHTEPRVTALEPYLPGKKKKKQLYYGKGIKYQEIVFLVSHWLLGYDRSERNCVIFMSLGMFHIENKDEATHI